MKVTAAAWPSETRTGEIGGAGRWGGQEADRYHPSGSPPWGMPRPAPVEHRRVSGVLPTRLPKSGRSGFRKPPSLRPAPRTSGGERNREPRQSPPVRCPPPALVIPGPMRLETLRAESPLTEAGPPPLRPAPPPQRLQRRRTSGWSVSASGGRPESARPGRPLSGHSHFAHRRASRPRFMRVALAWTRHSAWRFFREAPHRLRGRLHP